MASQLCVVGVVFRKAASHLRIGSVNVGSLNVGCLA